MIEQSTATTETKAQQPTESAAGAGFSAVSGSISERIDLDVLRRFGDPFNVYSFRGGYVVSISKQIVLCISKARHPDLEECRTGIRAQVFWAFDAIQEREPLVAPARPSAIAKIPDDVRQQLADLPGLQYVNVPRVRIWVHGNTVRQRWERIDQNGIVYFRWRDGAGCCVASKSNNERTQPRRSVSND